MAPERSPGAQGALPLLARPSHGQKAGKEKPARRFNGQAALTKSPGRFSAIAMFADPKPSASADEIRQAAARVMRFFSRPGCPDELHVLVALSPSMLEGRSGFSQPDLAKIEQVGGGRFKCRDERAGDHEVFVQISAQSDVHRLYALRVVAEAFKPHLRQCREIYGGMILNGEEPFGFSDAEKGQYQRSLAKKLPDTGSWLFFQRFEQELGRFFEQRKELPERSVVVGKLPAAFPRNQRAKLVRATEELTSKEKVKSVEARAAEPHSHLELMGKHKDEIVRRGFPCRFDGQEGLAFVGVTADFETIPRLLGIMTSGDDALLSYIRSKDGGVFFCPPDADWLDGGRAGILEPKTVDPLSHVPHLFTYDTTSAFYKYLMLLRKYGLFDNKNRPKAISKRARRAMNALYKALAQKNKKKEQEMLDAEVASFDNAMETNTEYAKYVTYG